MPEHVLDIHQQQFLVLLLVVQAQLDPIDARWKASARPRMSSMAVVDGVAVGRHFPDPGPAQQAPLGAGVAGPDPLVVGVPQIEVALVDGTVARAGRASARTARRTR